MPQEINVVKLAYEIIDMHENLTYLRKEHLRLLEIEKKYNTLLDSTIKHNDIMINNLIKAHLNKKIKRDN